MRCLGLALVAGLAGFLAVQTESLHAQQIGSPGAGGVSVLSAAGARLGDRLTAEGYLGHLSGDSDEMVYSDGARISRLTWTIEDALIVGTRVNYTATDWLRLGVGGWTTLTSDNTMNDYDWLRDDRAGWSDWSTHADTSLERAFEIDLSAQAQVIEWRGGWIDGLVGFQLRNFEWRASNGRYTYSQTGFRDDEGRFSGPLVDYEQWWRTPYVGLAAGYALPGLRLSGRVIASPFAQVTDEDTHILNEQRFEGDFDATDMVAVSMRAEHDLTDRWTLTGEANYQKFWEARGDMTVSYLNLDGWNSELNDAAGASNSTMIFSLGLNYRF